ncbi:hypothetical protein [Stenotrophomonas sp.]|uniref:hypothetical protein n=1 Tax=Stenotrophomonas sp. TaxID=69392 RepID=UPI002D3740A3|nr:hypothetical protein [Stenotrophomonas sp.]HYQ25490.1 hypothetical protein [Stenotrophomonas sp.]
MRDIRFPFCLSSAVSPSRMLPSSTARRHLRSFVLHRTTLFRISIGSAVMAEKSLEMPKAKAIHQRDRVHGNVYMTPHARIDPAHLMAVC